MLTGHFTYYEKFSKWRHFAQRLKLHLSVALLTTVCSTPDQSQTLLQFLSPVFQEFSQSGPSTACLAFFHRSLNSRTLKLIQIFLKSEHDSLRREIVLRLAPSAASCCYGINLSWYPVLSKFAVYRYSNTGESLQILQKVLILTNICSRVMSKYSRGPEFFEWQCSTTETLLVLITNLSDMVCGIAMFLVILNYLRVNHLIRAFSSVISWLINQFLLRSSSGLWTDKMTPARHTRKGHYHCV